MSERVAGWVGGKVGIQCLGLEMQRPNSGGSRPHDSAEEGCRPYVLRFGLTRTFSQFYEHDPSSCGRAKSSSDSNRRACPQSLEDLGVRI